ncbi:MAG: hypothetical protein AB1746_07325 [Candidatus Zixiibacteriota bacterium]
MMAIIKFIIISAAIGLLTLSGGCSLIGYGLGSAIDNQRPTMTHVENAKVDKIDKAEEIICVLKDDDVVKGATMRYYQVNYDNYFRVYESYRLDNECYLLLPAMGERLKVSALSGQPYEYLFAGFDVRFNSKGSTSIVFLIWEDADSTIEAKFANIKSIVNMSGDTLNTIGIDRAITDGSIPVLSHLELWCKSKRVNVRSNDAGSINVDSLIAGHGEIAGVELRESHKINFDMKGGVLYIDRHGAQSIRGRLWDGRSRIVPLNDVTSVYVDMPAPVEIRPIPVNDIKYIGMENSRNVKWVLLGVGAAIDVGMIILAIAMADMEMGLGSGGGSW